MYKDGVGGQHRGNVRAARKCACDIKWGVFNGVPGDKMQGCKLCDVRRVP